MASIDRIRANRRNAQKSTGPRTEQGKARSRQNALKHGLTGADVVQPAEEAPERERRNASWGAVLKPRNLLETWIVNQVVSASLRLERCARLETAQRGLRVERAACCWPTDRRLEVERLAARLAGDTSPALIVTELSGSSQGCDWLIARWRALEAALAEQGHWDDAQRSLAFDLLGVPVAERSFDRSITSHASREDLMALIQGEIQELEALKADGLDDLDATERALAEADLHFDVSPPAQLLRRYESSARRTLFWGLNLLYRGRRDAVPARNDDLGDDLAEPLPLLPSAPIWKDRPPRPAPKPNAIEQPAPATAPANGTSETPARKLSTTAPAPAPVPGRPIADDLFDGVATPKWVDGVVPISLSNLLQPVAPDEAPNPRHMNRRQRRALERKAKRSL
jgi:hypothetical protein